MQKICQPKKFEKRIYRFWEKSGFFAPKAHQPRADNLYRINQRKNRRKSAFCIIMPPPNANAPLHLGHAVFATLQDIMIRFHRLKGEKTLWLPGADHAGFETQVVYDKKLEKQGRSRFQIPPDQIYKEILEFTLKNKKIMENQLRKLGASCDWSREKFTLDPEIIKIVYQTFKKLFNDGLVYRGRRVINWCVKHQTSLSDLEVNHQEQKIKLTYIKYPFEPSTPPHKNFVGGRSGNNYYSLSEASENERSRREFITVATTRPETMLGDTAVAVNPKDKRYQELLKKKIKIRLPLTNRIIPLIADKAVDPAFGTGAVKVTPAHDPTDFEIGQRHNLETIQIIDKNGKMTEEAGKNYFGLKANEAREKVIEDLKNLGLVEKEEDYIHSAPICYKCHRNIEPLISDQWFIKIKPLAQKAIQAVKKGEVKFVSPRFEKIFFHWLKNIRDWNISRQIVWGIKIPVWYCQEKAGEKCRAKNGFIISETKPRQCPHCAGKNLIEETDTFDTWFSSGQWPFATLTTTAKNDFKVFYPTTVMETGWDILFFWVARMIMLGLYITGKPPFKYVFLHGLIRDKDRQKMSKSRGNVIDPLGVIDLYGADALRLALVFGAAADRDITVSEEKIITQRKFINKIWNAARFCLSYLSASQEKIKKTDLKLTKKDEWILNALKKTIRTVSADLDNFKFHRAAFALYHFFWHKFCDKTIEDVKERIKNNSKTKDALTAKWVLYHILTQYLKLLHPFAPFITEEIYQKIPSFKKKKALIIENWPRY